VGEKTGEIEELLGHVADLYDREINSAMDNINTLIEPIMLILIGFIVLLLGLGAMLPYLEVLKSAIS
jgi:type II secretory pathway component PulF